MKNRTNHEPGVSAGGSYPALGPYLGVALERHKARCTICRHARREEIEQDFLDWTSPRELAETYQLPDFRAIYRHATALGLHGLRRRNIQRATDRIIERVGEVQVNAEAVIAAIRVTLNEERRWLECLQRLNREDPSGDEPPSGRETTPQAPPWKFFDGWPAREPQPAAEHPAPEKATEETGANAPAAHKATELPRYVPEKSGAVPTRPAEVAPQADPYNAPGQVAGIPWPWPAKKIQFARRRIWRPTRPG